METKDFFSVAISALALIVSVIAFRRKGSEEQRTLRSQLMDTIGKIISVQADIHKIALQHPDFLTNPSVSRPMGMMNQQINALARLGEYIARQIPELVSDIEFAIIAGAFQWTSDRKKAEEYWRKAVDSSNDDYYKVLNLRALADFYFISGNVGQGRKEYERALSHFPISDDFSKWMTGETYKWWGNNETGAQNETTAKEKYALAAENYSTIANKLWSENLMKDLDQAKQSGNKAATEKSPESLPMVGSPLTEISKAIMEAQAKRRD